jgi:hypothetical protein
VAGADVVVQAVADVEDLGGLVAAGLDQLREESRVRLGGTPIVGGGQEVAGEIQLAQEPAGAGGLVAGDADRYPASRGVMLLGVRRR